ncbi:hypothetical protein HK100_012397 [Physocladia obscura]|uniref:cAMP-dependent protein kinase regulatory subunit n=1 Tax=Physocladia obscura TaxID=109957 RepID=A0AAD5T0F2_9FUNG|nr:hypothetical protein HK100_012397 [Physocladia obscura]
MLSCCHARPKAANKKISDEPQTAPAISSNTETSTIRNYTIAESEDDLELKSTAPVPIHNRNRRTSVSAESMSPTALSTPFKPVVIPKSDSQKERIYASVKSNILFTSCDEEQLKTVVDAMTEKSVAAGDEIIKQGGVGDYFYVVERGELDVFVSKSGEEPIKVYQYSSGGSFGELALMYNAPRAATVIAKTEGVLWALDRVTFRMILMDTTSKKRRMYEGFLEELSLLSSLEAYERAKIADTLESQIFSNGQVVIKQGDIGDRFYIIESGEASVTKNIDGVESQFPSLKRGDYFGELALLNDLPRQATISAIGRLKVASMEKAAFVRLLGPVVDIIKRNMADYEKIKSLEQI